MSAVSQERRTSAHANKKVIVWSLLGILVIIVLVSVLVSAKTSPVRALGGAVWLKSGIHYIDNAQISNRIEQLNKPKELAIAEQVSSVTPACDVIEGGFCQKSTGVYEEKTQIKPAVAFVPGTPERKEVTGYCTLCNDGTFSPSCAVGRGACSYHHGVASYNVARYKTIPGTAEISAESAVYSETPKTYKNSPSYKVPATPSLSTIIQ